MKFLPRILEAFRTPHKIMVKNYHSFLVHKLNFIAQRGIFKVKVVVLETNSVKILTPKHWNGGFGCITLLISITTGWMEIIPLGSVNMILTQMSTLYSLTYLKSQELEN